MQRLSTQYSDLPIPPMAKPTPYQDLSNIQELRISGGGAKGLSFPGVMQSMEEDGGFSAAQLKVVSGVSVGALLALAVTLRFSHQQFQEFAENLQGDRWQDRTWRSMLAFLGRGLQSITQPEDGVGFFRFIGRILGWVFLKISNLISWWRNEIVDPGWALCEGRVMHSDIEDILFNETRLSDGTPGLRNPTFLELQTRLEEKFNQPAAALRIITADISSGSNVIKEWSALETPNAPVVDVILAAVSIPMLFPPYRPLDNHTYCDAGVISCFLPARDPLIQLKNSLGVVFFSAETHQIDLGNHNPLDTPSAFLSQVANVCTDSARTLNPEERHRIAIVRVEALDTLNFGPTLEAKNAGIAQARTCTQAYLRGEQQITIRSTPLSGSSVRRAFLPSYTSSARITDFSEEPKVEVAPMQMSEADSQIPHHYRNANSEVKCN